MRLSAAVVVASFLVIAETASAASVTETFVFNVTNFQSVDGPPPPITTASGTFTITYDNAVFAMDAAAVSFSAGSPAFVTTIPVSYTYSPALNGTLNVGGAAEGTNGLLENTNDFLIQIETVRTTPKLSLFDLTQQGYAGMAQSLTGMVSRQAVTPEPASLVALLALGTSATRRRRVASPHRGNGQ